MRTTMRATSWGIVMVGLLVLPLAPAAAADVQDRGIEIAIETLDGTAHQADVEITRGAESVFKQRLDLPASGVTTVRAPLTAGIYGVSLLLPDPIVPPVGTPISTPPNNGFIGQVVDTADCAGFERVRFEIDGGPGSDPSRSGCLAPLDTLVALLADARGQRTSGSSSIAVPMPRASDVGDVLAWVGREPIDWNDSTPLRFSWDAPATFPDAYGRATSGAELRFVAIADGYGYAASGLAVQQVNASNTTHALDYADGHVEPLARWYEDPIVSAGGGQARGALVRQRTFDAEKAIEACVFRNPAQGATVRAGDGVAFCPALVDAWTAGRVEEHRGFRAIPLLAWREDKDGALAARAWIAEGIAYPLDVEWIDAPTGEPPVHRAFRLDRLDARGEALSSEAIALPPTPSPTGAIDALRGPALAAARPRFAFPLDAAVDAARQTDLDLVRFLVQNPDAALAGAAYEERQDAQRPVTIHEWYLVYTAPSAAPLAVVCQRADPAPATCRAPDDAQPIFWSALMRPPTIGASDVPKIGASFDDAVARWEETRPVTSALYRAWSDGRGPARVSVAAGLPRALTPASGQAQGASSSASVELLTARTRGTSVGVERASGALGQILGAPAPPLAPAAAMGAPPPSSVLVGAGIAAAAILALVLLALFARLRGAQVLASDLRQRILEVVREDPGIHTAGVMERFGRETGVTDHHLGVLVREGFLTRVETPGFRRYFVTGRFSHQEMRALAALRDGQNEKLFRLIQASPGIHLTELAERAGLSLPYASRTVKRLQDAGLVDRVQVGRTVTLHAIER